MWLNSVIMHKIIYFLVVFSYNEQNVGWVSFFLGEHKYLNQPMPTITGNVHQHCNILK